MKTPEALKIYAEARSWSSYEAFAASLNHLFANRPAESGHNSRDPKHDLALDVTESRHSVEADPFWMIQYTIAARVFLHSHFVPVGIARLLLNLAINWSSVYDLRSSTMITNDLPQALMALGNQLATQDRAAFRLVVEGPLREMDPIILDELYRITREGLRNAFSHARAQNIEVELTYSERLLRLRIRDDGNGIAPEMLEGRSGHYGLQGMRERAKKIGAKIRDLEWDGNRHGD